MVADGCPRSRTSADAARTTRPDLTSELFGWAPQGRRWRGGLAGGSRHRCCTMDDLPMNLLTSVVVPLASIAVGAALTYWLNVRARKTSQVEELINAAIGAVAMEEASRSAITAVRDVDHLPDEERMALEHSVIRAAIENHNVKNMLAREALARVMVIDQGVRRYYYEPETVSQRSEEILGYLLRLRSNRRRRRDGAGLGQEQPSPWPSADDRGTGASLDAGQVGE
jgi:hypothetical protein